MAFDHLIIIGADEVNPNDCDHDEYPESLDFNNGDAMYVCSNCGVFFAYEWEREADMGDTEWVE